MRRSDSANHKSEEVFVASRRTALRLAGAGALGAAGALAAGASPAGATGNPYIPVVDVTSNGADPTGSTDSTTAIQTSINSLPALGGIVYFPLGTYKVSSTLTIGNGSSSALSTKSGVRLIGAGFSGSFDYDLGYGQVGTQLVWVGSTADTMVEVKGPLKGWGIENIGLLGLNPGGSVMAATGLYLPSAAWGDCHNVSFKDCATAINFSAYSGFTVGSQPISPNCWHNRFENTGIVVPNVNGAKAIYMDGSSGANACFNLFTNTLVTFENTSLGVQNYGFYLRYCDNNRFVHTEFLNSTGLSGTSYCLLLDYTGTASTLPADNCLDGVSFDANGSSIHFANNGTPTGSGLTNRVVNISTANGTVTNPSLSHLAWGYSAAGP